MSVEGGMDQQINYFSNQTKYKPMPISSGLSSELIKNIVIIPYNDIKKTKKILDRSKKIYLVL